jgi:hypothetical protein
MFLFSDTCLSGDSWLLAGLLTAVIRPNGVLFIRNRITASDKIESASTRISVWISFVGIRFQGEKNVQVDSGDTRIE